MHAHDLEFLRACSVAVRPCTVNRMAYMPISREKQPDSDLYKFQNNLKTKVFQKNTFTIEFIKNCITKLNKASFATSEKYFFDKNTNYRHSSGFK